MSHKKLAPKGQCSQAISPSNECGCCIRAVESSAFRRLRPNLLGILNTFKRRFRSYGYRLVRFAAIELTVVVKPSVGALDVCAGYVRRDEPNRADRVIVAGDGVVYFYGVAVGIHERDHGHPYPLGLADSDCFLAYVNDEERARHLGHLFDTAEVPIQPRDLVVELERLFLRE